MPFARFFFHDQRFPDVPRPITAVGTCVALPPSIAAPVPGWPICEPFKAPLGLSGAAVTCGRVEWTPPIPEGAVLAALIPEPSTPGPCTGPAAPAARLGAGRPIAFLPGAAGACVASVGGCATVAGNCGAETDFGFSAAGYTCWARHIFVAAAEATITPAINPNLVTSISTKRRCRRGGAEFKSKRGRARRRAPRAAAPAANRGSCSSPRERR